MFSGHLPTTNKFTIQTPATKTYVAGEKLSLTLTFPFDIVADTTGGTPRLRLTVGATTRYATLVQPITDPTQLTFEYTFIAGENDTNGVDVAALELNGSTLQFDKDGVMTNCDFTTVTNKNLSMVNVDTTAPTITAFQLTNVANPTVILGTGKKLTFIMTFNEKVYLTNTTPEFDIQFDTGVGTAVYTAGAGTNILSFEYTITSSVQDVNGYNDFSVLDIGTGSIKDAVGNDANLDFTALEGNMRLYSQGVKVGGQNPSVVAVTFPANKTYVVAEDLDFVFEFDREVNVTGTPYLDITVSGATPSARQAQYVPEPGPTRFVTFRYSTVPGDVDIDGITVPSSLNDNGGTANIRDAAAPNNSFFAVNNNNYTPPVTTGIILNAIQPQAISVVRNADATLSQFTPQAVDDVFIIGQILNITVGFNTPVFVDQTLGTPYLPITIGATPVRAYYVSGSGQTNLIFRYTILEGELDTDGAIDIQNLNLNGGNIVDSQTTNILVTMPVSQITNTRVDGVRPVLQQVTAPTNAVYSDVAPFTRTELIFNAIWSEAVHYNAVGSISMTVNGTARNLESYNNDAITITHRPATNFPANVEAGIVVGSSITVPIVTDRAGNPALATSFSTPDVSGITVDTRAPTISDIIPISASATYKFTESIDFTVTFNESVTISRDGNYPRIRMTVGSTTTRYMTATTNGSGLTHTYRHTIVNNDVDSDGVSTSTVHQNQGTFSAIDAGRNPAILSVVRNFPDHKVDAQAPTFTVTRPTNGTYETGDTLSFTLNYSEPVTVDDTSGTPKISVTIGLNVRDFLYTSMVGNNLSFSYTLAADDFDPDGLPTNINTLTLDGGFITDVAGNNTGTTFPIAQNLSSVFVMFPNTSIWFQTSDTNRAKNPATATYAGAEGTLDTCGQPCRRFDGDDSINVNLTSARTVFMAMKTPPMGANHTLLGGSLTLTQAGPNYMMQFSSTSSQSVDGAAVGGTTSVNPNTTYVLQIEYAGLSYSGDIIDTFFTGSLGELMVVTGVISSDQKNIIRNYLLGKFP